MSNTISFSDFQKLDIRIGTVVEATVPEWSHWVMKLGVDFGPEIGTKSVFAGIMKYFKPDDVLGKQFPFVVNIEPKKIGPEGDVSEGMMLAACSEQPQQYALLRRKLPASRSQVSRLRGSGVPTDFSDEKSGPVRKGDNEEVPVLLKPWKRVPNGTKVR